MAVLLPLAAFAVLRVTGVPSAASLPGWIVPVVAALGAAAAAVALLLTVAAHAERGRTRDLGDAAGLGLLAATLAGLAVDAVEPLGLGIGLLAAAAAFGVGSAVGGRRLRSRRARWIGIFLVTVVIEAGLAVALFGGAAPGTQAMAPFLLAAGAIVAAISAALTWQEGARPTALGVAAASFAALALAGTSEAGRLPGLAGLIAATATLGWIMALRRLRRSTARQLVTSAGSTLPEVRARLQAPLDSVAEPEYDESARLTRELRATLDDLVAARRTIGLQRAEIERASSLDPLTGLPSRGPTLDRLRTEAAEARRYAHPVSVILLDIDGFAALNHDYGLGVGDAILREVALRLRLRVREADALGRVGGDAFLAILPHTDEGGAATFAQAVLDRAVERPFTTDRGELTVNVSLGNRADAPGNDPQRRGAAGRGRRGARIGQGGRWQSDRVRSAPRPGAAGRAAARAIEGRCSRRNGIGLGPQDSGLRLINTTTGCG